MARLIGLPFLLLFLFSGSIKPISARPRYSRTRTTNLEYMCRGTLYKDLCIKSLSVCPDSNIQSPDQLAQCALTVSLYRAKYTRSYMLKVASELKAMKAKEYPLVKDCLDQINDGVDQLSQSIKELGRLAANGNTMGGDDAFWLISSVETWVSAALTDAITCIENFPGRNVSKLKATIKGKVLNVAQTTSNALALFNRYAARYNARSSTFNNKP